MDRKEQIISLAVDLIRRVGYGNFSYQDLSTALGITKASIHYHFPAKEDLGLAVCQSIGLGLAQAEEGLSRAASFEERLALLSKGLLGEIREGLICPVSSLQTSVNTLGPELQAAVRKLSEKEVSLWADTLAEGQRAGVLAADFDPSLEALAILAALKGAIQYGRVLGRRREEEILQAAIGKLRS